jgi:drug/metabolite transporter (DMT)-like permease
MRFRNWFLKPQTQVFLSVLLVVVSQVCLKLGADSAVSRSWIDLSQLRSAWVWAGIVTMIASLLSWLHALRSIQLNIAYNLSGMLHVLVPLSSWLVLGETITIRQWLGIGLVFIGVMITSGPAEKALLE